jgi:PAS domain S-box-containing protein
VKKIKLPLKLKLFFPVSIIIIAVVTFITVWFVSKSFKNFNYLLEQNLELEVETIVHMFEREAKLKQQNVISKLNVAEAIFHNEKFTIENDTLLLEVENQETGTKQEVVINRWKISDKDLLYDHTLVDSLQNLFGATATIFQKTEIGFVRISTNVRRENGERATATYIPNESPVAQTILNGTDFYGRAKVVDDWYTAAYRPLYSNNQLVGMLYVGDDEKDLAELERILYMLKIGESGYPLVFDNTGNLLIHPSRKGEAWGDSVLFQTVKDQKEGIIHYNYNNQMKTMAFCYFERFDLYIAATVFKDIETRELKKDAILGAIITAIIAIILLLGFLYYFTTDRLYKYFIELQQSRKKLDSVSRALEESEERFKKLFDSTGDDIFVTDIEENIVEINSAACETLGYSREELLKMKITEIKSAKYINSVSENRRTIFQLGNYTFDSEHVTKSGDIIQVEFTSRLVSYEHENYILSVVRNISKRREVERQILSAVIRGEERERQRFAREMHDGLGPLLSTIKLYVNELDGENMKTDERKELIKHSNELIDEAVTATRTISNNLMPTVIHNYGLIKAIDAFCDKVNKINKLNMKFETENIHDRLDQNLEIILFRVISELINNTIKHAQADNVYILIDLNNSTLNVFFKDDGVGFDVEKIMNEENKGMGLKNIISRIKSIDGRYYFNSAPNEGFTMKIEINM